MERTDRPSASGRTADAEAEAVAGETKLEIPSRNMTLQVVGMTCGLCANNVEAALRGVEGVEDVAVNLANGRAHISYLPALVTFASLQQAVEAVGYGLRELPGDGSSYRMGPATVRQFPARPIIFGFAATLLLSALYILIVGLAQDFGHAFGLLRDDWPFAVPIVAGFGTQVGLFVQSRSISCARQAGATTAISGAGTGTSTVSMIACCAHHLSDLLPIIGLSGATLFLNENRIPLMLVGITANAFGIAFMLRLLRAASRQPYAGT